MKSELVIGLVGPVGVEKSCFHNATMARLRASGHDPQLVRLSQRLDDLEEEGLLATELESAPEYDRIRSHRDAGDALRSLDIEGARGLRPFEGALGGFPGAVAATCAPRESRPINLGRGTSMVDVPVPLEAVRTPILLSHRVAAVRRAHPIAVLDGARLVERGTPAELLARGGVYAELCRTELEEELAA